jgi:hypothetical protein
MDDRSIRKRKLTDDAAGLSAQFVTPTPATTLSSSGHGVGTPSSKKKQLVGADSNRVSALSNNIVKEESEPMSTAEVNGRAICAVSRVLFGSYYGEKVTTGITKG